MSTTLHDAVPQCHAKAQSDLDARQQAVLGIQLAHADGSARPFRLAIEPVRDAQGRLTHWLAIDHND